jgi:hypothetical protein
VGVGVVIAPVMVSVRMLKVDSVASNFRGKLTQKIDAEN